MNYYWMFCDIDESRPLWLFFEDQDKRVVLECFRDLACAKCGKVNEFKALRIGLETERSIKTKKNVVASYDGMKCTDSKATKLFRKFANGDIEFVPVSVNGWNVLKPVRRIKIKDPKRAGMLITRVCDICHRPRELKRCPKKGDLVWPRKSFHFALIDPCLEGYGGKSVLFMVSQAIVDLVKNEKISGPYFRPVVELGD